MALAIAAAAPAKADNHPWNDEVGQWFVAPFVGMTFVDDDRLRQRRAAPRVDQSASIADNATEEGRQENRRVMLVRTDSGM